MITAADAYMTAISKNPRFQSDLEVIENRIKEACEHGILKINVSGLEVDNFGAYISHLNKFGYKCHYIVGNDNLCIEWSFPKETA